jgi:MraZ protein
MLLLGEFEIYFTGQGRILIHKKIREELGETKSFVITKGFDICLAGFRTTDWENGAQALMTPSLLEMDKIEIKRHLFSSASQLEIDDQGRVVVPKNLLSYANLLQKEMLIIGVGTHFEIWDKQKWHEYQKGLQPIIKNLPKN